MTHPADMHDDDIEQYEEEIAKQESACYECPDCGECLTPVYDDYNDSMYHPRVKGYTCDMCGWWE